MTSILLVLENALASLSLLGLMVVLGLPIYASARRFALTIRAPLGISALYGLAWLTVWSWYGLAAGVRPASIYRALIIATPVLAGVILTVRRPRLQHGLRGVKVLATDVGLDLLAFTMSVLAYTGLIFSKLAPDDLPWVTILDADIYVYLKSANWLSFTPVTSPRIGYTELQDFVRSDVFGCFNLLAFGRFAFHIAVEKLAIPTLGVAVGLVGVAVARSCRLIFRLGLPLSLAVSLTVTTGPLFVYVVLNYFLSQTLFVAILMTVVLQAPETEDDHARGSAGRGLIVMVAAPLVLLCYDVWAIQFAIMVPAMLGVAGLLTKGESRRSPAWETGIFAVMVMIAFGSMALVSPTRLYNAVDKLRAFSVPNAAGWPLPFVDLDLLLGLPIVLQGMDSPRSMSGPILAFALMLAALVTATVKLDQGPGVPARQLTLGCFLATIGGYLFVWLKLGETYQQWKFASSLPLCFGFAVPASAIRLAMLKPSRARRRLTGLATATFLIACVVLNIGIARDIWMANLVHSPVALANLARTLDATPGGGPVHVTLDDFYARHVALVTLNHRPLTFDGATMFGFSAAAPADRHWTEITTACSPVDKPPLGYLAVPADSGYLPLLPAGRDVALSGEVATCVRLSGFGAAQIWGRATDAGAASIRFRCGCPPASGGYRLVVRVAIPEGFAEGAVRLSVNQGPAVVRTLIGPGFRDVEAPLPRDLRDEDAVELTIEVLDVKPQTAEPARLHVAHLTVVPEN